MTNSDPRYPIGLLTFVGRALTDVEREERISALARHPERLRVAVDGLDRDQLDTPYRDGGWTVRQVVHHLVDSHVNAYVRFKLAVTEDRPTICTYEQDRWASLPEAQSGPIEPSLAILDGLHERWVAFLSELDAAAFARGLEHPELGTLTVDQLLEIYAWHCPHHEGHITALRARRAW